MDGKLLLEWGDGRRAVYSEGAYSRRADKNEGSYLLPECWEKRRMASRQQEKLQEAQK